MEWEEKMFSEIVEFPPKISLTKGESYSFIPMEDLKEGYKYVSPSKEKNWKGSGGAKFENGDTLFARITPCLQNGKIAQVKNLRKGKGFGSTEYFIFRGIKGISDNDFIFYLALTEEFRKNAIGSMVGASGRQRADAKFVGNYLVTLPPLSTQRRIASILSAYDDLIENNMKRIQLLEELAQRTYEEWFVKFRIPGVELEMNEESGLPVGWERKTIGDCCDVSGGGTPSRKVDEYWINGKINWFSPTDLSKSKSIYQLESSDKINELGLQKSSAKLMGANSFMMTSRATIGLFGLTDYPFTTNQGFINVTSYEHVDKEFLFYNFMYRVEEFKSHATGATFPEISKSKFKVLPLIWPPKSLIHQFHNKVFPLHQSIINLTRQNRLLKESRDLLLPRLMNGKISVEEAELGMVAEEREYYKKEEKNN